METLKPKVRDDSLHLKCEGGNELDSDKQAIVVMTGGQTCGYTMELDTDQKLLFITGFF